jgi:hypothetical protein
MSRKFLWIAAAIAGISGLCLLLMRSAREMTAASEDRASEAQWANEGGANSPPNV